MSGDWIKVETTLPDKPEVIAIAAILDIDADAVVGKLVRFWAWADQHTVDGNAVGVTKKFIDRCTAVAGFGDALESVGWLTISDGVMRIPNFAHHNGQTGKSRALTSKRVANHRSSSNAKCNAASVTSALAREEKRREEISQETQSPPASPDLFFDDSKCFPIAATFYRATGSDKENDPFPWQLAVLVANGLISRNAFCESIESLQYAKRGKCGYFRRCIERHVGGKEVLRELLGRVRLTKDFPRAPPQTDQAFSFDLQSFGSESLS